MNVNVENINQNDFQNICRTCLNMCDVKLFENNVISNVFYKLTDIQFKTNDDLPQQICSKCFEKINEIHVFASRCKQSHSTLTNCLNKRINEKQDKENSDELGKHNFEIKLEENITIDEEIYTRVEDENLDPLNVDVQYELKTAENDLEITTYEFNGNIPEIREINGGRPINCFENVECVNYVTNNNVNSCDLNGTTYLSDSSTSFITDSVRNRKKSSVLEFKCEDCNRSYKSIKYLNKHKGSPDSTCPYKCQQCSKTFTQLSSIKTHLRLHSGELPYKCDKCSKSFNQLCSLQLHMRWHNGERPYKCDLCSKSFNHVSNLKSHIQTHSGERPHKCDQCSKSYTRLSHLRDHMRKHLNNL